MDLMIVEETGAVTATAGVASSSVTVPAGFERIGISSTGNAHFRMGKGAQTALVTDPMVTASMGVLVMKVKPTGSGLSDTLAVIRVAGEQAADCAVSVFGVRES